MRYTRNIALRIYIKYYTIYSRVTTILKKNMKSPERNIPTPTSDHSSKDLILLQEAFDTVKNKDSFSKLVNTNFLPTTGLISEFQFKLQDAPPTYFNKIDMKRFLNKIVDQQRLYLEKIEQKQYEQEINLSIDKSKANMARAEQLILSVIIKVLSEVHERIEKLNTESVVLFTEDVRHMSKEIQQYIFESRKKLLMMDPVNTASPSPTTTFTSAQLGDESSTVFHN